MYFLMYIVIAIGAYVYTFNKDFNSDDISKATLFLSICGIAIFVLSIIASL